MKIAIITPYGDAYANDKLFDLTSCSIGQNLLLPGIMLKKELEKMGHEYHTVDMYEDKSTIDVWIFQDINNDSRLTADSLKDWIKYIVKKKWKQDYLAQYSGMKNNSKAILIMQEPATIFPKSYNSKNHVYFERILTWDQELVDNQKYYHFFYPQVKPEKILHYPYEKKKYITTICGNKCSSNKNELYSERLRLIKYFERENIEFDLYGVGWDQKERTSYRGKIKDKLETMSHYKFSICFENMRSKSGYITEKIFDSFFSGCIPIYYGAEDILEYVPENTFIDYRKFASMDELNHYLMAMTKEEYELILDNIKLYLDSDLYKKNFSIETYVGRMVSAITR